MWSDIKKSGSLSLSTILIWLSLTCQTAHPYAPQHNSLGQLTRRKLLSKIGRLTLPIVANTLSPDVLVPAAHAKEMPANQSVESDIATIRDATEALTSLLENWERATVDCTYADVPRDLLEAKNKEKLLEKASEFALFDKSTSVISCKKTNRIVRDYLGVTAKGPLVGLEKRLLKQGVVERVDPDSLDDYFTAVESFSQAISRATSLSYTAGVADFDSMNNFEKGNESASGETSNLEQSKKAIDEANTCLKRAVSLFVTDDP